MAIVRPEPEITSEEVDGITQSVDVLLLDDEKIYVAIGKDLKECKSTLLWVIQKFPDRKICLLHVHQPAQMIPLLGGYFPASKMKPQEVHAYHEMERRSIQKVLKDYIRILDRNGIAAVESLIEANSVECGIVESISQLGIKQLVMGAAADKHYSKRKLNIKSKKAQYVNLQSPATCRIWFICKGHLIYERPSALLEGSPASVVSQPRHTRSQSVLARPNNGKVFSSPFDYLIRRARSVNTRQGGRVVESSPLYVHNRLETDSSSDECNETAANSPCSSCHLSVSSSNKVLDLALVPYLRSEGNESELELNAVPQPNDERHPSPPSVLLEGNVNDEIYDKLDQALVEAHNSKREAFEESLRRRRAEKDAIEAIRMAKAAESLYNEEQRQRKVMEERLLKEKKELEKLKSQQDELTVEFREAMEHKLSLESQIADSENLAKELEVKIISAVELLQKFKKERDELEIECNSALIAAEEMRTNQAESSGASMPWFTEFSFSEIQEATQHFDLSSKIGEGGYGSIYKGILRHTEVAIKMLNAQSLQGPSEYQQEVEVLSKLRHPNLVTLVGACPEAYTLVYEYLPNGSLEDRLSCKDNTPPLSWQSRIRIAAELCSVLIFLHSSRPCSIIHGDLKPANILLDKNFVSKLSDFGICRKFFEDDNLNEGLTQCHRTAPKGTIGYMDPDFLITGELTPQSDVYSFGIILLMLLTGRPAVKIAKDVKDALDNGNLKSLLDYSAGDWPYVQARQLADLALRCAAMNRRDRADLQSDVRRVLEPMSVSCGGSLSTFSLGSEEFCQAPHYFVCPIFQEVMQDPHVAADGFTYEAEAFKGWLAIGHDTSPMTDLKLVHTNLVPNLALRSAIQEWRQSR